MPRTSLLFFVLLISFAMKAQEDWKSAEQFASEIDTRIPELLRDFSIPGAAVAIIEDGEIVLEKCYGYSDIEKGTLVDPTTGFNIGSISKTLAAWGIMKLVQDGQIELDAPAGKYLTRWKLPESEFDENEVTIRRLLSHTAGLSLHGYPGWSPKDELPTIEESLDGVNNGPGRVEIIMEPGTKYKYSGGGYTMLQLIIEEVTGQKFENFMQVEVLDPMGMTHSSYKIDDRIMQGSAREYNDFGEEIDFELFTAQAAAGLHTTPEDFLKLAYASLYQSTDRGQYSKVVPDELVEQMMTSVPQASGTFGYGMGYQVDHVNGYVFAGHGGDNTGWHAIFRVDPTTNDGFIALTNGGRGSTICYQVYCAWTTWKTGSPLGDWCAIKSPISNKLKSIIDKDGIDNIAKVYVDLKEKYPVEYDYSESQLNNLGYHYFGKGSMKEALAIFQVNIDAFPDAFNTYDSYGEALLADGSRQEAIKNYTRSIQLNPGNQHGIDVLNDLGVNTDELLFKIPVEQLEPLQGEYTAVTDINWKMSFVLQDGELVGNDGGYKFRLLPVAENSFVYANNATSVVFNTDNPDAITAIFSGRDKFIKVR